MTSGAGEGDGEWEESWRSEASRMKTRRITGESV